MKDILASSDSNNDDELSDHSNKASDTNDIVKKNKKEKHSEKKDEKEKQPDEKNEASGDDGEKSVADKKGKWKNDPLLKKKLNVSASDDSEDELLRFRDKKEALAKEVQRYAMFYLCTLCRYELTIIICVPISGTEDDIIPKRYQTTYLLIKSYRMFVNKKKIN